MGNYVELKKIKVREIQEVVNMSDQSPEEAKEPKYELCTTCKAGRLIPTEDPELFKCSKCYSRKISPRFK